MRSSVSDVLPSAVKRSLAKFGSDLATARRKRRLTAIAVAERMGVSKNTYLRVEKGDACVGLGSYGDFHPDFKAQPGGSPSAHDRRSRVRDTPMIGEARSPSQGIRPSFRGDRRKPAPEFQDL